MYNKIEDQHVTNCEVLGFPHSWVSYMAGNLPRCEYCGTTREFIPYTPKSLSIEPLKFDSTKPDWSQLPWKAVEQVIKVLDHGAKKYTRDNWRSVLAAENGENRYLAAALRHLAAYGQGELLDPESGLPHLAHAACCLLFLLEKK